MMKKLLYIILFFALSAAYSQNFETYFENKTLRLDYVFSGNHQNQTVVLDELVQLPQWAGRKHNLSENYLQGDGQIKVYDTATNVLIYTSSFSSLFQEWQSTTEAKTLSKSFENTFLIPFPKQKVKIDVLFFDEKGEENTLFTHIVNPEDMLIRKKGIGNITIHQLIHKANSSYEKINVVFVAEGFQEDEMDKFHTYAKEAITQILAHQPFDKYSDRFNFYAVESISKDKGVSIPRESQWKSTAVEAHFDTFYSERYLTTSRIKKLHDLLAGIPYQHIIILANTAVYGGGGIYNSYTLTTTEDINFKPVVVHEFGHSFAGLADEYFYESDVLSDLQSLRREPWERNITTLINFKSKWQDLLSPETPIPTPIDKSHKYPIGVYEGLPGLGIYKATADCRMKTNTATTFCPVCQRSIEGLILYYTQ